MSAPPWMRQTTTRTEAIGTERSRTIPPTSPSNQYQLDAIRLSAEKILDLQGQLSHATVQQEKYSIWTNQLNELMKMRDSLTQSTSDTRTMGFDMAYLPLFTILSQHPQVQAKQRAAQTGGAAPSIAPDVLPHTIQTRLWEVSLECVTLLLTAAAEQPFLARATFAKRYFGIFQLILQFVAPPAEEKSSAKDKTDERKVDATSSSTASHTSTNAGAPSEEMRLTGLTTLRALFTAVEFQFSKSTNATSTELQPLIATFQQHPGFSISLGYYIHLLTRAVAKDRHRGLRLLAVASLDQVAKVLQHPMLNKIDHSAALAAPSLTPVPGSILLLAYFPGLASCMYNVLLYDAGSAHSGGWKLRLAAWELLDQLVRAVVTYVAGSKNILQAMARTPGAVSDAPATADPAEQAEFTADEPTSAVADRAMQRLWALMPTTTSNTSGEEVKILTPAPSPSLNLASVHPVLQSVLKPLDLAWWIETRKNIGEIMSKVFAPASQLAQRKEIAASMVDAVERYLLGEKAKDELEQAFIEEIDDSSSDTLGTIYTTLLPSQCTLAWLEFLILTHEHDDPWLRQRASEVMEKVGERVKKANETGSALANSMRQLGSSSLKQLVPSAGPSLVPLLRSSLSRHLLSLPRMLATSSESAQIATLKTVQGYVDLLGRQGALWEYISSDVERVMKILYASFTVEGSESKVLEREKDVKQDAIVSTSGDASSSSMEDTQMVPASSTALSTPTYYSFSFTHAHSSLAHDLSLSILRSMGKHVGEQFGLLLAHFHERLLQGIEQVQQGNFTKSNQLKESVLFLNQLILGVGQAIRTGEVDVHDVLPHVELVMFEYLSPALWHLSDIYQFRGRALKAHEQQNNLVVTQLLVRGIGDMAEAIGGEEWKSMLMHLLYPLFAQLGSPHAGVHQAALVTMHRMALACGYADESTLAQDDVLQRMIVENMDYLVEQIAVELRGLDMTSSTQRMHGTGEKHPLTLPLVLSALLTKISLQCTKVILPLLDDVLKVLLDKLCELSLESEEDADEVVDTTSHVGRYAYVSTHMSRLAYLEILRSVVTAIHLLQDSQPPEKIDVPSIFASAPPVPLMPATSNQLLKSEQQLIAQADSMLSLDSYAGKETSPEPTEPPEKKARMKSPESSSEIPPSTDEANSFAPISIRKRLETLISSRREHAERSKRELEWLESRARNEPTNMMEDITDVPRDAEGKTDAEKWYTEREAHRAREAEKKYNQVHGIDDPELEEDLEKEAKAHSDPPEIPLTKDQQTVLSIFSQCRNFLLPGSGPRPLAMQVSVLRIAAECIPVLAKRPKELFPQIAKFWPALLQSLKLLENAEVASSGGSSSNRSDRSSRLLRGGAFESSVVTPSQSDTRLDSLMHVEPDAAQEASEKQLTQLIQSLSNTNVHTSVVPLSPGGSGGFTHSTASPLFVQSLSVLALLARCASKFLSGRFTNELWPSLQGVLKYESRWMAETRSRSVAGRGAAAEAALRLTPAFKVQRALLETLVELSRFPDLASQHLLALAEHVAPYLSRDQPIEFQQLASSALRVLMQHDADIVWFVLWKLCPSIDPSPIINSVDPPQNPSFLSHPVFQHVFPNFDARFLAHLRMKTATQVKTGAVNEFTTNVNALLAELESDILSRTKLSLI